MLRCAPVVRRAISLLTCIGLGLLLSATALAQQPVASPSQTANSITGRIVDRSGQPVAGAVANATVVGNSTQYRSASSDNEGNFKIDGLDAVAYNVWAAAPGFISEQSISLPDSERRYFRTGDSVTLTLIKGGVITGTVTNAASEPVVAAYVRAIRIKDADGKPVPGRPRERYTDDRGVYRIYGLVPGTYLVSAGGPNLSGAAFRVGPYNNDAPTYAPSGTRDAATEIVLRAEDEVGNVDIRYRGEPGHAARGMVLQCGGGRGSADADTATD